MSLQSSLFGASNHAIILQYHRFGESKYPSTDISIQLFTKQIDYLVKNNYTVWKLSKIVRYLLKNRKIPDKTISLTMDDAYKSVYTQAYPLLKKYHLPFTVFVNSEPVINKSKMYMSWDEMREMGKNGAEFANHSYSHQYLVRRYRDKPKQYAMFVKKELQKCEIKIEKELGKAVSTQPKMLAYPFGEYDLSLIKLVKNLGYIGVAQNSAPISNKSNFMALTRFPMSGGFGEMEKFILKIQTIPMPIKSTTPKKTIVDKKNNPPHFSLTLQKPLKDLQCFTSNGKKINMKWISDTQIEIESTQKLKYPRNHYTCTAHEKANVWYWYSHLWVILKDNSKSIDIKNK